MIARLLTIFLLCVAAGTALAADTGLKPKLDIGKGGQCVDDPKFMRDNHMRLLRHQRDETLRQGVRGGKYKLADCVECHASAKTGRVVGTDDSFCQGCHRYAAVRIDCFECHASKRKALPESGK